MSVTTYTREGFYDVRALVCSIVKDLTGGGNPIGGGTAASHMTIVYKSANFDENDPVATVGSAGANKEHMVILESTSAIDPFARSDITIEDPSKDPWRIAFHMYNWSGRKTATQNTTGPGYTLNDDPNLDTVSLAVYVGTPATLAVDPDDPTKTKIGWTFTTIQKPLAYLGYPTASMLENPTTIPANWTYKDTYKGKDLVEPIGNTGAPWTNSFDPTPNSTKMKPAPQSQTGVPSTYASPEVWDGPDVTDANQLFVNRYIVAGSASDFGGTGFNASSDYSQPMSYRLTLTDHGMFLGCWGPDPEENGKGFSWLLVQRPVDKKYGIVRGLPVDPLKPGNRPLFCVNSVNGRYYKFAVREHDNPVPSARKDATLNNRDSGAVINPYQQQSLTENGEYVITFLNNLNSSRFKYSDELDMLGTVSSDVVGGGSDIDVSVYNEQDKRSYHALWSSGSYGTKMRIMVVNSIPSPNVPT